MAVAGGGNNASNTGGDLNEPIDVSVFCDGGFWANITSGRAVGKAGVVDWESFSWQREVRRRESEGLLRRITVPHLENRDSLKDQKYFDLSPFIQLALIQHGSKNLMSVGEDSRALVWLNADIEACYGALMQEADAGEGGNAGSPGASGSPPKLAEGEQEFSADSTTFGEAFMALKKIYMAEYETEVPAVVVVQGGGGQENNALQKDPSVYLDFFEKRWLKKRVAFQ